MSKKTAAAQPTAYAAELASINEVLDRVEAQAMEARDHAEIAAEIAPKAGPVARDPIADANAQESARREYRPRPSLFASEAMRARALVVGPAFFSQLVREYEAAEATHAREPAPGSAAAIVGLYGPDGRPVSPYSFIGAVARRIAKGALFMEDVDHEKVTAKGGTFAEWAFNAARMVNGKIEAGIVDAAALDPDIRAALAPSSGYGSLK